MPTDIVILMTTVPVKADALALARTLVDEKLAACVNVLPTMTSVYRWKGAVEQDEEQQLIIKTTVTCIQALQLRLAELHSYEMPESLVISVNSGADNYLRWVRESTTITVL
tara:strand:- start:794 stop:1126 length:333 start_codon:yes stop_codon:yes gene_type:complete